RLIEFDYKKQVDYGKQKACDWGYHPGEKERDIGRLTPIASLYKLETCFFLTHPLAEVEPIDNSLNVLLGRFPERDPLIFMRQSLAFALANFLSCESYCSHAFIKWIDENQRHCERQHCGSRGDSCEQLCQCWNVESVGQEFKHRFKPKNRN